MPDQVYIDLEDVRTADDALLTGTSNLHYHISFNSQNYALLSLSKHRQNARNNSRSRRRVCPI